MKITIRDFTTLSIEVTEKESLEQLANVKLSACNEHLIVDSNHVNIGPILDILNIDGTTYIYGFENKVLISKECTLSAKERYALQSSKVIDDCYIKEVLKKIFRMRICHPLKGIESKAFIISTIPGNLVRLRPNQVKSDIDYIKNLNPKACMHYIYELDTLVIFSKGAGESFGQIRSAVDAKIQCKDQLKCYIYGKDSVVEKLKMLG